MIQNKTKIGFVKGFTLLELLVALALMDVIALALYSSMRTGFRAKDNTKAMLKPYQSIAPAFEFIRRDICSAVKPSGELAGDFIGENSSGRFSLNEDSLSFYTCDYQPQEDEISSNVINIQFALEDDYDTEEVVLKRFVTKNVLSSSDPDVEEEVICRDVLGFDIMYYDGSDWVDEWDTSDEDESDLPWAVKVTITLLDNESRFADEDNFRHFTRIFLLPFSNQESESTESE